MIPSRLYYIAIPVYGVPRKLLAFTSRVLRHSFAVGWAITRSFTDQLIEMLSEGDPEFRKFLKMGDDPEFDE